MRLNAICVAAALGLSSLSAQAADATGKYYVAGSLGYAMYDLGEMEDYYEAAAAEYNTFGGVTSSADIKDANFAFSLAAGYEFNQYVAAELFYRNYGKAEASVYATDGADFEAESDEITAAGLGVGVVGFLPVSDTLRLFARVDAVNLKLAGDYSFNSSFGSSDAESYDDTNVKIGLGIGAQFAFGDGWAARADLQRIEGEISIDGDDFKSDINSLNISVLKSF